MMSMKALVVDDSKTARFVLKRILLEVGFQVVEAGDGQEALQRLKEIGAVDVALVDMNMPTMNGTELVRAMRADATYAAIPVMMVTAESEASQVARALEAGANEYVMKPFTKDVILSKLSLIGITPRV
jgi:two-component system chemotaxis response regulator CheY